MCIIKSNIGETNKYTPQYQHAPNKEEMCASILRRRFQKMHIQKVSYLALLCNRQRQSGYTTAENRSYKKAQRKHL
jgi:hypothetical protein